MSRTYYVESTAIIRRRKKIIIYKDRLSWKEDNLSLNLILYYFSYSTIKYLYN